MLVVAVLVAVLVVAVLVVAVLVVAAVLVVLSDEYLDWTSNAFSLCTLLACNDTSV